MILLLARQAEPTLQLLEQAALERGLDAVSLVSTDVVRGLSVRDTLSADGTIEIEWTQGSRTFSGRDVSGVVNLLDDLDFADFAHVGEADRVFAWREFRAYLAFSLGSFANVVNPPSGQHLAGSARSLCHQWMTAARMHPAVVVPRWFYGREDEAPPALTLGWHVVVAGDPFAHPHWDPSVRPYVDRAQPHLFYEVPAGRLVRASVLDDRVWSWPSVSERAAGRIRALALALSRAYGLRWSQSEFFVSGEPEQLTFGAIRPSVEVEALPVKHQRSMIDALLSTLQPLGWPRADTRTARAVGPRLDKTLISPHRRRIPAGADVEPAAATRGGRVRGILLIASELDPTADYFHEYAQDAGVPITWWRAEEVVSRAAAFVEVMQRSAPEFGVYYRRPGTRSTTLDRGLRMLDDLVAGFHGVVVGDTYNHGSYHSKALHNASISRHATSSVHGIPTVLRSGDLPEDDGLVVKALSSEKAEVVTLSAVSVERGEYPAPVQLQRLVRGANVRVHVCAGDVCAVEITSPRLDYRFDPDFGISAVSLAPSVLRWCLEACAREQLVFAGIDLLRAGDTHYCLEVNPNPGYHVFEERLVRDGGPPVISRRLAAHLRRVAA